MPWTVSESLCSVGRAEAIFGLDAHVYGAFNLSYGVGATGKLLLIVVNTRLTHWHASRSDNWRTGEI